MCINFEFSILSFIIGELSGYLLNNELGKFIMFYSFIQLFEAMIYLDLYPLFFTKMIILNLCCQGLFLFYIKSKYDYRIIILLLIGLFGFYKVLFENINKPIINNCILWNPFMDNKLVLMLTCMYIIIILSLFDVNKTICGYYTLTFLFSLIMSNKCYPGYWCLTSAILAPIFLTLNNTNI